MRTVDKVAEFHRAFEQQADRQPGLPAISVTEGTRIEKVANQLADLGARLRTYAAEEGKSVPLLRLQLIVEEVGELAEALFKGDLVETADALTDIQYVLDGTYLAFGLDGLKDALFDEVHRSNMSKLDENGRPIIADSGRVVKSALYSPPDLKSVFHDP